MTINVERIRFGAKLHAASDRAGGSLNGEGASAFVDRLFGEWKASGSNLDAADAWLRKRLTGIYQYASAPPVWVEEEGVWMYLDGEPMIFLTQFEMPLSGVVAQNLSAGEVVYLFGMRKRESGKTRMVYATTSQFRPGF